MFILFLKFIRHKSVSSKDEYTYFKEKGPPYEPLNHSFGIFPKIAVTVFINFLCLVEIISLNRTT